MRRYCSGPDRHQTHSNRMKRTGLNSSTIYTLVKDGTFPKWANLPKIASGWLKSLIEAWLLARNDSLTVRS